MRTQLVVAGALALIGASSLSAQELKFQPPNLFGQKKPAPKPPAVDWNAPLPTDVSPRPAPSVVCGMTMIPGDPTIDPKIVVKPKDTNVKYTLKVIEPMVCKP